MPIRPPTKPNTDRIAELLAQVATGKITAQAALHELQHAGAANSSTTTTEPNSQDKNPLTLDLDRHTRCGFPEVVYGQGKSPELVAEIVSLQQQAGQPSLVTRSDEATAHVVETRFRFSRFNPIARTISVGIEGEIVPEPLAVDSDSPPPHVAVVTAGSTDAPVAEEAAETLAWMGIPMRTYNDIGVAGPDRLLTAVGSLRQATAVVVIAGMEGALPAAVGGHLSVPVIAVPTSVGYGATLGGLTPLMGMLSSCASNVAVVNIDAGFKGAYLAGLITKNQS